MQHFLIERTHSINVGELNREGALSGCPMRFPFLGLTTRRFKIEYRGSNWPRDHRRSQIIPVIWTRCHFGGMRPWLVCLCEKRVAKLTPASSDFFVAENVEIWRINLSSGAAKAGSIAKHRKSGDFSKTKVGRVLMHSRSGPAGCIIRRSRGKLRCLKTSKMN